jgi:hypothetical protein
MTTEQALKILSDESEAFANALECTEDRPDYISDLFRPGNAAELYIAQQTIISAFKEKGDKHDGKGKDYPRAS